MKTPPIPRNEKTRMIQLLSYDILDTTPEDEYNHITELASTLTKAPICLVSLIDTNRQWFKSCYGIENLKETDRAISFCGHAINHSEIFIVENPLEDERFKDNPVVTGGIKIRFYAGVPLIDSQGFALGTLCVINTEHQTLDPIQQKQLKMLAHQVIKLMELRKANKQVQKDYSEFSILSKKYIDQQVELEKALETAAKLSVIGEISASIAHEIKNPLLVISASSELLCGLSENNSSDLAKEVLSSTKVIDDSLDRINKIIRGLTNNARSVKDPFQNVSVMSVIDDCLAMVSGKIKNSEIAIKVNCANHSVVLGRSSDIGQVLTNLLNNSIDAISSLPKNQKWINIDCSEFSGRINLSVTDGGPGISKDVADHIFDSFYTTKEVGKGTGLGLSISQKVIHDHNGKIYYDDTSANTKFIIELPISAKEG